MEIVVSRSTLLYLSGAIKLNRANYSQVNMQQHNVLKVQVSR